MRMPGRRPVSRALAVALGAWLASACAPHAQGTTGAARVAAPAPAPDPCDTARTQLAMTSCRNEAARRAEAAEADLYARAIAALKQKGTAAQVGALESAERKWRDYRDATCQGAADLYAGGSLAGFALVDCRARLASARAAELQADYLDWAAH